MVKPSVRGLALAGASCALVLSACGGGASASSNSGGSSSGSGSGSSSGPYVVGAVTALSGPLAFIGNALKGGSAAYYDYVNAHGGINGHKIVFYPMDDGNSANQALTATHQLVQQDHVVAISGWVLTNLESAVEPYAQRQNVVMMAQGCDPTIASAANKVVFCAGLPETIEATPLVDFAASKAGSTTPKVAVIDMNSEAQVALQNTLVSDFQAKHWPVVSKQLISLSSTDETAQANAVVQSGATMVVGSMDSEREQLFVQALKAAGSSIPVINFDAGASLPIMKQLDYPNLYVYSPFSYPSDTTPGVAAYNAAMKAAGQDGSAAFAVNGYGEAVAIVAALKACGYPCTPSKMVQTMTSLGSVNTNGLTTGPMLYSSSYRYGLTGGKFYAWSASAGKPVPVSGFIKIPGA